MQQAQIPQGRAGGHTFCGCKAAGCMHPPLHEAAQEHVTGHSGSKSPQVIPGSHASDNSWMATGHTVPKGGWGEGIQGGRSKPHSASPGLTAPGDASLSQTHGPLTPRCPSNKFIQSTVGKQMAKNCTLVRKSRQNQLRPRECTLLF